MSTLRFVLLAIVLWPAVARADATSPISGSVVSRDEGLPVADATVVLLRDGHVVTTVTTDAAGHFRFAPVTDGTYSVGVVNGAKPVAEEVVVAGAPVEKQLLVGLPEAEAVQIYETAPATDPEPPASLGPRRELPYSAEAADSDAWGSVTAVAYIDEHGRAVAMQLLKRAGHGLDAIAVKEVFGGAYQPARDRHGRTMRSVLVLHLDWPSFWWMHEFGMSKRDAMEAAPYIPCAGAGPLNLGSIHPVYRDCGEAAADAVYTADYVLPTATSVPLAPRRAIESLTDGEKDALCTWTADLSRPYGKAVDGPVCRARLDKAADCDATVGEVLSCSMNKARDPSSCGVCSR